MGRHVLWGYSPQRREQSIKNIFLLNITIAYIEKLSNSVFLFRINSQKTITGLRVLTQKCPTLLLTVHNRKNASRRFSLWTVQESLPRKFVAVAPNFLGTGITTLAGASVDRDSVRVLAQSSALLTVHEKIRIKRIFLCGPYRTRTCHPIIANDVLYQMS